MVTGVDRFRAHFADHDHQYVLIGGAACELIMDDAGLDFRATKDLDGERIILTNHGRKVAEIGPVRTHKITLDELERRRNQLAYNGPDADALIDTIRGAR